MKSWQPKLLGLISLVSAIALGSSVTSNTLAQSTDLETFRQQALTAHNVLRQRHGSPPLVLDDYLNNVAQDWAQHMAATGQFEHRPNNKYGENISYRGSSQPGFDVDGREPVQAWYKEIQFYNYNQPGFSMKTGHFTQVVWRDSRKVGCGKARARGGKVYIACNYDPPGNYKERFRQNVLPGR